MKNLNRILSFSAAVTLSTSVIADEVIDQLEIIKRAYEAGELKSAVDSLNYTIGRIQEKMQSRLLNLLPEPLDGWQADPAKSQSGGVASVLTGNSLSRRYFRSDGAEITLNLIADSPLLPMLTMALSVPFVMQSKEGMRSYLFKGYRGTFDHKPGTTDYGINLLVGSRLLIQGSASGLVDEKPLEQYLDNLNIDRIQQALVN